MAATATDRTRTPAAAPPTGVPLLRLTGIRLGYDAAAGFHLAVDATSERAVARLRERKHRDEKPFAVMVRTLDEARRIAVVGHRDAALLMDRARPVVVLRSHPGSVIAPSVSPGLSTIGVMLAYTPVHHLLLDAMQRPLVMTSGNRSDEPIAATIPDAVARLDDVADLFLFHDREIVSPVDDSVVRLCDGHPAVIRRARGYAPRLFAHFFSS